MGWGGEKLGLERPGPHKFCHHLVGDALAPLLDARDEGSQQIDQLLLQVPREEFAASVVLKVSCTKLCLGSWQYAYK